MIGIYSHGRSYMHLLDPRTKLALMVGMSLLIYSAQLPALTVLLALVLLLSRASGLPYTRLVQGLRPVLVFFGVIFLAHLGGSAGIGVLMGPTGGYLIGFIAGAFIVGLIHERSNKGIPAAIVAMVAGLAVIYLSGVAQLSIAADMPVQQAVVIGVLPFLVGDVIKMAAALIIVEKVKPLIVLNDRS